MKLSSTNMSGLIKVVVLAFQYVIIIKCFMPRIDGFQVGPNRVSKNQERLLDTFITTGRFKEGTVIATRQPNSASFFFRSLRRISSRSSSGSASFSVLQTTKTESSSNIDTIQTTNQQQVPSKVPIEWRGDVLRKLKNVIDPDLGSDIVTLGFVQNLKIQYDDNDNNGVTISFDVELTTPACPVKETFASDCRRYVLEIDWVDDVDVTMTAQSPSPNIPTDVFGMSQIGAVIAVSSCKGGVGKSTTAVNLAYQLAEQGATVGILDADIYGPSLPTMVKPDDEIVRFVGRQIAPLQRNNVKLMSFGYINDEGAAAVMRGPMITQLLDQFLSVIHWGSLDYLLIDMPPGTGDIQLTLTQRLNITAAVIVTTPTQLSFTDVIRGIDMFDSVNVPCIAVVENMAYYEIPKDNDEKSANVDSNIFTIDQEALKEAIIAKLQESTIVTNGAVDILANELVQVVMKQSSSFKSTPTVTTSETQSLDTTTTKRIPIFGKGHKNQLMNQYGIEHTYSVPLLETVAAAGDNGTPYVLANPYSTTTKIYDDLAKTVVQEVAKIKFGTSSKYATKPIITYNKEQHIIQITSSSQLAATVSNDERSVGTEENDNDNSSETGSTLTTATLRRNCRCASCVEELTGRQLLIPTSVSESIYPIRMYPTGNYALSVDWSDGHRSLYPYKQIRSILQEKQENEQQQQQIDPQYKSSTVVN